MLVQHGYCLTAVCLGVLLGAQLPLARGSRTATYQLKKH